jgi:hypothetical protein
MLAQVLAVYRGTLDLHGRPVSKTWTRLSSPSPANSTRLCLLDPVDWAVGAEVVVASTDHHKGHAETRRIVAIYPDAAAAAAGEGGGGGGSCLEVDTPLNHFHDGTPPLPPRSLPLCTPAAAAAAAAAAKTMRG